MGAMRQNLPGSLDYRPRGPQYPENVQLRPAPHGHAETPAGAEDLWRIRVRQYRVIYQILDDRLIVTARSERALRFTAV